MEPSKEDFSILGLRASAYLTTEMVRKAYRNMAKQVHPDRNDSPSATVEFQQLNQAYMNVMYYLSSLSGNSVKKKKWDIVLLNNMSSRPSVDQGTSNVVIKSLPDEATTRKFIEVCSKWYGEGRREQNARKFVTTFRASDGASISKSTIHISVYDNGTIMCQGSANCYWHADHLPLLIKEVLAMPSSSLTSSSTHSTGSPMSKLGRLGRGLVNLLSPVANKERRPELPKPVLPLPTFNDSMSDPEDEIIFSTPGRVSADEKIAEEVVDGKTEATNLKPAAQGDVIKEVTTHEDADLEAAALEAADQKAAEEAIAKKATERENAKKEAAAQEAAEKEAAEKAAAEKAAAEKAAAEKAADEKAAAQKVSTVKAAEASEEAVEKVASLIEASEIDAAICAAVAECEAAEAKSSNCDMDRIAVNLMTCISNLEVTLVDMLRSEQAEKFSLLRDRYETEMELLKVKHKLELKQKDDQIRNLKVKKAESPKKSSDIAKPEANRDKMNKLEADLREKSADCLLKEEECDNLKSSVKELEEKLKSSEHIKFKLGQERDKLMAERDSLLSHQKNESDVKNESSDQKNESNVENESARKNLSEKKFKSPDVLVITNSNGAGLDARKLLKPLYTTKKVLEQKNLEGAEKFIHGTDIKPEKMVILQILDNSIGYKSSDQCGSKLLDIIKLCHSKWPGVTVKVVEPLGRKFYDPVVNERYCTIADRLCQSLPGLVGEENVIHIPNILKSPDESHFDREANGLIHLNRDGYKLLAMAYKDWVLQRSRPSGTNRPPPSGPNRPLSSGHNRPPSSGPNNPPPAGHNRPPPAGPRHLGPNHHPQQSWYPRHSGPNHPSQQSWEPRQSGPNHPQQQSWEPLTLLLNALNLVNKGQ